MVRPTDPRYAAQWHFKLLGNIERIWDDYTGAGVSVGVFDDGIQYVHPDLNDNYDATKHFSHLGIVYDATPITLNGPDPDGHGTSVAGIIAGEWGNGIGGVGVASGATLTGVNVLSDTRLKGDDMFPLVLRHAAAFDVMSNSWAYDPYFGDFQNLSDPDAFQNRLIDVYREVAQTGRGGLGTIIVQAAGNEGLNASGDGLSNSRHLISVSALYANGNVADYSNFGPNILVSAGAAQVTTDLMGANGYNKSVGVAGDYGATFGGTSAAAPVVSGVVALMLEANPDLGWRDVKEILATSARLTGSVVNGNRNYEVSETGFHSGSVWNGTQNIQRDGDTWNDGGRGYSQDYGFGAVNAFAAVRLAEVWGLFHPEAHTSANEIAVIAENTEIAPLIYDNSNNGYVRSIVSVGSHLSIENIQVTIDITLDVTITANFPPLIHLHAPDGSLYPLIYYYHDGQADFKDGFVWTYGISQALGIDSFGDWSLSFDVHEGGLNPSGAINSVKLEFFGSVWDVDNVHTISQDYLLVQKVNSAGTRDKIINDTNGGTDWMNMAMLSGNVVASLVGGAKFSVNRVVWGSMAATAPIENLITGDGNDSLTGNAGANEIHAMRGNDYVTGGDGADQIYGGAGSDKLRGDTGADWLYGDAGNDDLNGGIGNDVISGGDGIDLLTGDLGDDRLGGNAGADALNGGAGRDTLWGGDGADKLSGDADADQIFGEGGNDRINGGLGDDSLSGGAGNDVISEATLGGGNDVVRGGEGRDSIALGTGDDRFDDEPESGLTGSDTVSGGSGNDTLAGAGGNDSLLGDAGNDLIWGGIGNDILNGGAGLDMLEGGSGNDLLTGGLEADSFVFNVGSGADRITDFKDNIDTLQFDDLLWGGGVLAVADLLAGYARIVGGAVVFDFGQGDVVTLTAVRSLGILLDDITLI